jgi:hypothetical protein
MHRLVPAPAAADHAHFALSRSPDAYHYVVVEVHPHQVRMRQRKTLQLLFDYVIYFVDELLHCAYLMLMVAG